MGDTVPVDRRSHAVMVAFECWCPQPPKDFEIIITGSVPSLGNWFPERPVRMTKGQGGVWSVTKTVKSTDVLEYRYACYSEPEKRCVGYEQGHNRKIVVAQKLSEGTTTTTDATTGLPKILVKDVWSAQNQRSRVPSNPRQEPGNMQRSQSYSQSQTKDKLFGPSKSFVNHGAVEAATSYLKEKMGRSDQANDNADINLLKQQLKEQKEAFRRLEQERDHAESEYKAEMKKLEKQTSMLKQECENSKRHAKDVERASLADGESAAAATAASLQKQLNDSQTTFNETITTMTEELAQCQEELKLERDGKHEVEGAKSQLQAELQEKNEEVRTIQDSLAQTEVVVCDNAKAVDDPTMKTIALDSSLPLANRTAALLEYLVNEGKKTDANLLLTLHGKLSTIRSQMDELRKEAVENVQSTVQHSMDLAKNMLTPYMEKKDEIIETYLQRYEDQFKQRRVLANEIVDLKGKIRVFGRARPFNERERTAGHANVVAFPESNRLLIGMNAEKYMMMQDVALGEDTEMGKNDMEEVKTYELDHIFPPTTSQEEVFSEVEHLIGSTLDGYNVTIFAYGQTGSGKTHTMDGSKELPGITYRSLRLFFGNQDSSMKLKIGVQISMLEIYNEDIRDLLYEGDGKNQKLDVRQSADGGSHVPNLTLKDAESIDEAFAIMDEGRSNRKTKATNMNATSSRSHMVFTAYVTTTHPTSGDTSSAKLHLVDLAGSERVGKTGASGETLKEAQAINKSLSALGDVIASLTNSTGTAHVPYRNSKLTFLLKDSLCGNSRTAMFLGLSPSSDNYWETISTLNFGARAASVELGAVQKQFESGELSQLRNQIMKLQDQLKEVKGAAASGSGEAASLAGRVTDLEKENDTLERKLKATQKKMEEIEGTSGGKEAALNKKLEKTKQDLKDKDVKIAELEAAVKKGKKEVMEAAKGSKASASSDASSKEVLKLKKEFAEMEKKIQTSDQKIKNAEAKTKKAEAKTAAAEDKAKQAREEADQAKRAASAAAKAKIDTLNTRAVSRSVGNGRPRSPVPIRPSSQTLRATSPRPGGLRPRRRSSSPVSPRARSTSPSPGRARKNSGPMPAGSPRKSLTGKPTEAPASLPVPDVAKVGKMNLEDDDADATPDDTAQ